MCVDYAIVSFVVPVHYGVDNKLLFSVDHLINNITLRKKWT